MPGLFFYCFRGAAVCSAALCGLRPRHFDLAFMRNYIALKHVFRSYFRCVRLVPIRNYIALKQGKADKQPLACLIPIRNYITLKRKCNESKRDLGLVPIRNYIALKPQIVAQAADPLLPAIPYRLSSKNLV